MKFVLLVAAEAREFTGLARRLKAAKLNWPLAYAFAAGNITMVADGAGQRLAARAVAIALERQRPEAIVSTGFCGGLAPRMKVGDILTASRVIDAGRSIEYSAELPKCTRPFITGTIISQDRVACSLSDKRRLRAAGADGVEMEAAGVAARASMEQIPFFCVRSVSDTADEEFTLDFNLMRDEEGRFSRSRIIGAALRKPFERVPALLRLNRAAQIAAESLGEFLVDCRF
jgi:adenosylhomocysteine nucleosidase